MPKFRTYIIGDSGGEHFIEAEFTFSIMNNGIGFYEYWGAKGFDKQQDYIEDVNISSISLIHEGIIKEAIDKLPSSISKIQKHIKEGKEVYVMESMRKISLKEAIMEKLEQEIKQSFDFTGDLELEC